MLEIFEMRGATEPDVDQLLLELHRKHPGIEIKKIDVLNEKAMESNDDVKDAIRNHGTEILPLFRLDGVFVEKQRLEKMVYK